MQNLDLNGRVDINIKGGLVGDFCEVEGKEGYD
jgi:hypothetical protein